MERFSLGNITDWAEFAAKSVLEVWCETDSRQVALKVFSTDEIALYVIDPDPKTDQVYPVGLGRGIIDLAFTVTKTMGLFWEPLTERQDDQPQPNVRLLSYNRPQFWEDETGEASFTTVEPRGRVESLEVRRMQKLMMHNIERRLMQQQAAWMAANGQTEETDELEVVEDPEPATKKPLKGVAPDAGPAHEPAE